MKQQFKYGLFIILFFTLFFTACDKNEYDLPNSNQRGTPLPSQQQPPSSPPQAPTLQLFMMGNLSQARYHMLPAATSDKVLFVGGRYLEMNCYYDSTDLAWYNCEHISSRVDIYDTTSQSWSTYELPGSAYTPWANAVSTNGKVFLAGGYHNSGRVDVYDGLTNTWSFIQLPVPRVWMSAAALGGKVYFAGGRTINGDSTTVIDIYDVITGRWSNARLSVVRENSSAVSVGDKIFFAGGMANAGPSSVVDMYSTLTNQWSTTALSQPRYSIAVTSLGSKALFAGGESGLTPTATGRIDIYDNATGTWTWVDRQGVRGEFRSAASLGSKAFFFNWSSINIYEGQTNSWSLHQDGEFGQRASVTLGSKIYIAGGYGNTGNTDKVWIIRF